MPVPKTHRHALRCATLAWLAACGPQESGSDSTPASDAASESAATTSSSTTTGDSGPTTGTSSTTSTSIAPDTSSPPQLPDLPCEVECTGGFIEPLDLPAADCDIWTQDCPEGQKCVPYSPDGTPVWTADGCFPVVADPVDIGEPCTFEDSPFSGRDNCDVGAMCWDGDGTGEYTCAPLCTGTAEALTCPEGFFCSTFWEALTVCERPACDPLKQDCSDPAELCVPNIYLEEDWCLHDDTDINHQVHEPCESETECDKGLACIYADSAAVECGDGFGCCEPFCEIGVDSCPGVGQVCAPWFTNTDVGVCQLP
ncbi:hypothetical protein [Nannocystis radixulma]|uniref:Uncharacterized protein n=1 Tax=Nannocystis radixulma TaxID=2995305 RepID=A0ABT5BL06_9BACT|nr:hypothetical protein [Nannocystis radixulma]MDC0674824.1 hypothetical protein [Nannocystis radixulma]